ncbi:MAG: polysaccharide biosynthesis protein, partial [Thermodesulfobacteriota bacterium]
MSLKNKAKEQGEVLEATETIDDQLRRFRVPIAFTFHMTTVFAAYIGAFILRFDFTLPREYWSALYTTLPMLLIFRAAVFFYYRFYSASWRFVYLRDIFDVIKAVTAGSAIFIAVMVFTDKIEGFPRSIFLIEPMLTVLIISGTKLFYRYFREFSQQRSYKVTKNLLIVGAGKAGVMVLNELRGNKSLGIMAVGFIDDGKYRRGTTIQGVPVLGGTRDLPEIIKAEDIDEVIIAIPSIGHKEIMRVSDIVRSCGIRANVMPSLGKIIQDGRVRSPIKNISVDDLLGRRTIKFSRESDLRIMGEEITDKAVLVTGAGGSIGSELCRHIALYGPRIIILFERHETSLYDIELEMRKKFPEINVLPVVGDITDYGKIDEVITVHGINLIYHAAAYKHVPMMEREPLEAVKNNVFGTLNLAGLAVKHKVEKLVLISTDKAVNPANIMGSTKRVTELIGQVMDGQGTKFIAVRFGNVVGSNGSVIPIFRRQIADGGPVTVTHAEMTRFFMSIPEAVQLVMTAGAMGTGGEIFLLDMGSPVKIVDVAKALIELSGLEVDKDVEIQISGVRPGEKLHEELYWHGEGIVPTDNKKITMLKPESPERAAVLGGISEMKELVEKGDLKGVIAALTKMVP